MTHTPPQDWTGRIAYADALDLNAAAPSDIAVMPVVAGAFHIDEILFYNVTAAATGASIGVYTGANGTGDVIMAPTALTGLIAADYIQQITDGFLQKQFSASNLYVRLTTANGSAASCSIGAYGRDLS